ncbi:hypothetical protein [Streptomyces sp. W4I9-2]|uniref:hypothetical protein n=1 Tax=Streptomyces sp. W4I9-2 TaxID=3042297 RepID=UPI0027890072|nr:hypothetical protein [Streptomyces sp. W4I9-2]MDQ0694299.1 hypothetical protein [Streptomyces sp. W4I9-2]
MPQNPTPAAAGDTNPTTQMPGEDAIREQVRRLLATADGYDFDGLEPHDYENHASVVLDMIRPLVNRVAKLETALEATGRSLSSFIFDSDDPGADALGAQWLYWQAMPLVDDPFVQPRAFRSSVFSEASKAAEALDTGAPSDRERPQAYLDGYSDGVQDVTECLEKLADQAAEGSEPTTAPSQREAGAALGRDLPEEDPGRCLNTHPFSPRDGWRLICGSCDHAGDAPCHREAGAL